MSTLQFYIEPQHRKDETGPWLPLGPADTHRATRYAVCSRRQDAKRRWVKITYSTYKKYKQAAEHLARLLRSDAASRFRPKPVLGNRMPPRSGHAPLAVSLSEHQYLMLQQRDDSNA